MNEPDAELEQVRLEVAAMHGLPEAALPFVVGSTLDQIEASADTVARLLAAGPGPEPEPTADPLVHALANAGALKAQRQRELMAAVHGPRPQPRDERGRFEAANFDGGARRHVAAPRDPAREHNKLLLEMASLSRMFGTTVRAGL